MTAPLFHRYPRPETDFHVPALGGPYYPDSELSLAVNTALCAGQPLLLTGEPGCGKTALAESVAMELSLGEVLHFSTRSENQARDVLYQYDSLRRLLDVQVREERARQAGRYVRRKALGEAIYDAHKNGRQRVVLIDEIDKAPADFANDLLNEIDRMAFTVTETGRSYMAPIRLRPVVIITSNVERQLPRPFLRRCVFHHIDFPNREALGRILRGRFESVAWRLCERAIERFLELREVGLEKQPATAELIGWVRVLLAADVELERLGNQMRLSGLPSLGMLVKGQEDRDLLRRL